MMKRILVVDDDQMIREIVVRLLSGLGYDCAAAADGLEAVAELKHTQFAVVVTDMMMPRMDGMACSSWGSSRNTTPAPMSW